MHGACLTPEDRPRVVNTALRPLSRGKVVTIPSIPAIHRCGAARIWNFRGDAR